MKKTESKHVKIKYGFCIFCGKSNAQDYAVHGRGKGSKINYFHRDCYLESVGQLKNPEYTGR